MAIYGNQLIEARFTKSFYKHILGHPLSLYDFEDISNLLYKSYKYILDNDIDGLELNDFTYNE